MNVLRNVLKFNKKDNSGKHSTLNMHLSKNVFKVNNKETRIIFENCCELLVKVFTSFIVDF